MNTLGGKPLPAGRPEPCSPLRAYRIARCCFLLLIVSLAALPADSPAYHEEIETWRRQREQRLKADDGWLTVTGLFWLQPGENRFGSAADNRVVLPPGAGAPSVAGSFFLENGQVRLEVKPGTTILLNGRPVQSAVLKTDASDKPDSLKLGTVTLLVLARGDRFAIRMRDTNSELRRKFTGLSWFPIDETYRVTATFHPYQPKRKITVPDVTGGVQEFQIPGYVAFTLQGRKLTLEPAESGDSFFFLFKDQTSGKLTYPAGRYLYTELPKDGKVMLDFNKAYNPPCAFTPYATCPLPPKQNHLPVAITAGEKNYHHD